MKFIKSMAKIFGCNRDRVTGSVLLFYLKEIFKLDKA